MNELLSLSPAEKLERGLLYTPAEIAQQPETWRSTADLFDSLRPKLNAFLFPALDERRTVWLIGAGSSDYIGHALVHLLRKQWGLEVNAIASTDLLTNRDDLILPQEKYLWISFSRSGDSPEAVAVLEQALEQCQNVKHLIVSCNESAKIVALGRQHESCLAVVLDDRVNDRSLAMTSSFTNMIVFGQCLSNIREDNGYRDTLEHMCEAATYLLEEGSLLAYGLASRDHHNACYVGSGALGAIARESALKLTELTAGTTRVLNETTLGLRHGPMSSLNMDTLLIALLSQERRRRRYDSDLIEEIRRKQVVPAIIAVGGLVPSADNSLYHPSFDSIADEYLPPVEVIFGQLLALFSSIRSGLKPDSPSPMGVISRVVGKFQIHE